MSKRAADPADLDAVDRAGHYAKVAAVLATVTPPPPPERRVLPTLVDIVDCFNVPGTLAAAIALRNVNKELARQIQRNAAAWLRNHGDIPAAARAYYTAQADGRDGALQPYDCLLVAGRISGAKSRAAMFLYLVRYGPIDCFTGSLVAFAAAMLDGCLLSAEDMASLLEWPTTSPKGTYLRTDAARWRVATWFLFERVGRPALREHLFPHVSSLTTAIGAVHILDISRVPAKMRDFGRLSEWKDASHVHVVLAANDEKDSPLLVLKEAVKDDEIDTQTKLSHTAAAVPKVLAADATKGHLLMEYFPYNLQSDLDRIGGHDELRRMLVAVGSVVTELSRMKMVHNDLYPRNVLFDDQGRFVLADFGVSSSRVKGAALSSPFRRDPLPSVKDELRTLMKNLAALTVKWKASAADLPKLDAQVAALTTLTQQQVGELINEALKFINV